MPKTQRRQGALRATLEALPILMYTLTLIRATEGHSGLQTGVNPAEVTEEWLHLLAGRLAFLWDPGMDTAGRQEVLPRIWSARQATVKQGLDYQN